MRVAVRQARGTSKIELSHGSITSFTPPFVPLSWLETITFSRLKSKIDELAAEIPLDAYVTVAIVLQ